MMSELQPQLGKAVLVEVTQSYSFNGQTPTYEEAVVEGSLFELGIDGFVLAYEQVLNTPDNETPERRMVTLKWQDDVLTQVTLGDVHARQTFGEGEWFASQFFNEGRLLLCKNFTKKLDMALHEEGGMVDLLYELWSGETHLGYYNLELFIY
jgi:uncharacterized beta-barrel protein YwiB (DUF1934 family)